jgi:lipopolysaccharide/colanic/teichoic acid biosynthesis glycosyltransferase
MKRLLDIVASLLLLVLLAPIMAVIALGVLFDVGAPVLFRQVRPGLHGRPFTLFKFRTMRGAHAGEPAADSDHQRLTPFGRWLRTTSLDELPELWNVLRGDMSLVGPRPLLMRYLPLYSPDQMRRHDVRPGLTGWAQVNGRNALGWDEKFKLDLWYVDNRSLLLDLRILLRTAASVFKREGISHEESATMPEFTGSRVEAQTVIGESDPLDHSLADRTGSK